MSNTGKLYKLEYFTSITIYIPFLDMSKIFKPEKINLQNHPEINEAVIQDVIANNPSILGL